MMISICIPAYKQPGLLKRLFDSISIQVFRDFEVIITDDSPGTSVYDLCKQYASQLPLQYFKNVTPLGTPENWNEAIRHAKGEWIKVMHHDDWFFDQHSLEKYIAAISENPSASFFFSAYWRVNEDTGEREKKHINGFRFHQLLKNPCVLVSDNVIGPPSVVLYKNDTALLYDKNLKWLVDIDFYIRYLQKRAPVFIHETLVNIGVHKQQVTQAVYKDRSVEIPENFNLLNKMGIHQLRHLLIYDAWWRLLRKLEVKNEQEIREAGYNGTIHPLILSMIKWQRAIPRSILTMGIFSKGIVTIHSLLHRHQLSR